MVAQLARILDDGARSTTRRVRRDHRSGINPHEETLTQNFVSDYVAKVRRAKLRAGANEFTKYEEARIYGADIALWFTNAAGQFAGVYLQAKVLRSDGTYRGLNHSNRWGTQHQILVEAATRDGVLAGYAFHNGLRGSQPAHSLCGHGVGAPDINGINIASANSMASHIRRQVPRTAIEVLCSPLSCLVRHGGDPVGGAGAGISGPAAPGGVGSTSAPASDLPEALLGLSRSWEQPEARLLRRGEIPPYVRRLADQLDLDPAEEMYDDDRGYIDDLDDWPPYRSYLGRVNWADLNPFFTTVLVGPTAREA